MYRKLISHSAAFFVTTAAMLLIPVFASQPAKCTYNYQGAGEGRLWGLLEKKGSFPCQKFSEERDGKRVTSRIMATLYGEKRQFIVGSRGYTDINNTDGFYSAGSDCMVLILRTGNGLKICAN